MQESNVKDITTSINSNIEDTPRIVQTDIDSKDGQNKCPKCGATDISLNASNGKLRCNYCRYEFNAEKVVGLEEDISKLQGQVIGSGATDIISDTNDRITLKCSSCGAEVVINTASATQARCHWCRNTLSINQQIPNGSIPDMILPFHLTREEARKEIEKFVGKRTFFAHPTFKKEFTTENIMGVYFPYMVVDINGHANFIGQGEHLVRRYTTGSGDDQETCYDADLYNVERSFDLTINGLTIESNSERLNNKSLEKTNNVINAIMPFDVENAVKYNANYLNGYTSEKRDTNIAQLHTLIENQSKDIARFAANDTLTNYDRGVCWSSQKLEVKGEQWRTAYLPVWLYSYQQVSGNKKVLHYVAVNARTKETMGSVPIHMPKLLGISCLVELLGILAFLLFIGFDNADGGPWIFFLAIGFLYFIIMYMKYRNHGARHRYESETKTQMSNLKKVDSFVKQRKRLRNERMQGANNIDVSRVTVDKILDSINGVKPLKDTNKSDENK